MYRTEQFKQSKQRDSQNRTSRRLFDAITTGCGTAALLLGSLYTLPLSAAEGEGRYQNHEEIYASVEQFIRDETQHYSIEPEITVGRLDKRLRVADCPQALKPFLRSGAKMSGNTTIGVKCSGDKPWTAYLSATIRIYDKIAVASAPLPRGHLLQRGDIILVEREVSTLSRGFFDDLVNIEGLVLKQSLKPDTIITPSMVKRPRAVKRRDGVVIIASTGGMTIRTRGEAMADGAIGERIKVKNSSSKRVIDATIVQPGVVEVAL